MEKPLYIIVLFGGLLSVSSYPMNNDEDNRGYYGLPHVSPEMIGLIDATPRRSMIDKSENLNLKDTIESISVQETKKRPLKNEITRKRSMHVSKVLSLVAGISKKRSEVHESKNIPFKKGVKRKRSINELDMPPMRKSSNDFFVKGYYGLRRVTPEMIGLIDAAPRRRSIDISEELNLKDKVQRNLLVRETKSLPLIKRIKTGKRSVHTSGLSKKGHIHESKNTLFKNGISRKRSVNELDMPPMRRSSIVIEAYDSKSLSQPQTIEPVQNPTVVKKDASETVPVLSTNTTEAFPNTTKQEVIVQNNTSDSKKKSSEFPGVEDNLLQMTHHLLSDMTGFQDNVDDVKEASLSRHGEDLEFEVNVQKRPGEEKRNEITGSKPGVNPFNVMVSKNRFEDYLINRFISYVCGKEC